MTKIATIIDVSSGTGYEGDARIRRAYVRNIEALSGRYAYDHASERVVPVDTAGSVELHFAGREPSQDFIAGERYWLENGRDQIPGYSVKLAPEITNLLDDAMTRAFRAVGKARKRERTRRQAAV